MTTAGVLLCAMVFVPLLTALTVALTPWRWPAVASVLVTVGLAIGMLADRNAGAHRGPIQPWHSIDLPWIPALDVRFRLGIDGISWPLVALTVLLTACCVGWLIFGERNQATNRLLALVFVMEFAALGVFLALDAVLFVVFFELTLVPMYAIIAGWGGQRRAAAARTFVLYTVAGSVLLVIGVLWLIHAAGTSNMIELAARGSVASGTQLAIFVLLAVAFAVKAPLWPLHTWLPDAHTQAPTVGSVLLAGVLLKLGSYGLIRVAVTALPAAAHRSAGVLAILAVAAIVIGAGVCLATDELKRLIAYSSVGHMGFVMLGIASLNEIGMQAAQLANVAHGLITGLLFFCVGAIKTRTGTGDLADLGGLRFASPRLAGVFGFAAVASFGLPGLAGFWGEAFAIAGAASNGGVGWWIIAIVAGAGAALVVAYFLRMLRLVVTRSGKEPVNDLTPTEALAMAPLIIAIVVLGVWPGAVTNLTQAPVADLIAVVTR